ncbi:craniofacial development protein 2-like [Coccinella septempunctata]|uniref:craniofacial development protein 2-like n=1 Tax=Coccinella septempunctata TaxID=41139 RepID=UPI001D05E657|nr:craniofacial development protein 2-like [Coccinella septempunctata]
MVTTQARNRTTRTNTGTSRRKQRWRRNVIRAATWNIMSWNTKNAEILLEMEQHKIDICALSETKRKGKGSIRVPGYIFVYSGVSQRSRATAGVGILISEKLEQSIEDIHDISERFLKVTLNTETGKLHLFSVYAPDISKPREETAQFYEILEEEVSRIPQNERMLMMGDLNARIGNSII